MRKIIFMEIKFFFCSEDCLNGEYSLIGSESLSWPNGSLWAGISNILQIRRKKA